MSTTKLCGAASITAFLVVSVPALAQSTPEAKPATPSAVTIDQLEDHPEQYVGQQVRVSGEVGNVLGPHLFTIDERNWIDFDGENLVFLPAPLAALVSEDTPVTVTGTVRTMVQAEIERERGWFGNDEGIKAELHKRPVIVADSVRNTRDDTNLTLRVETGTPSAAAPAGAASPAVVNDLAMLAGADDEQLVGRWAELPSARVDAVAKGGGFWVVSGEDRLFVMPMAATTKVTPGQTVGLSGVVLALPPGLKDTIGDKAVVGDEEVYVYASRVIEGT